MRHRLLQGLVCAAALAAPISAGIAAPSLDPGWGDGMVLQQGQPITLSGTAQGGAKVSVRLGKAQASAVADDAGRFAVKLPAFAASDTPQTLFLSDPGGTATYADILIGDVFLCGGQSNMELPVARALDADTQLGRADDNGIRLLMVPKATAPLPQQDFASPVTWQAADRSSVERFSAACFFMAKALRAKSPATPVGLIHANWGGSTANAWLDRQGVRALHGAGALDLLSLYVRDPYAATQAFVPQWFDWWRAQGTGSDPWSNPQSLNWKPIPRFSFWNAWEGTGLDTNPIANVWLRQTITLTGEQAQGDGSLAIGAIDDLDLTFVNGEAIGYTFGWGVERTYRVPANRLKEGENIILIAANNAWDSGGFFAGPERLHFTAANGERVALGADWEYFRAPVDGAPPRAPWDSNAGTGVMHNAMIAPLGPMRLAGVVWYQGESDVGSEGYDAKLRALFAGWRRQFGAQTKVLVVQLADFGERRSVPVESQWAKLRDEQRRAVAADANAALVSAIDLGEASDIHPANKNDLGKRLALAFSGRGMPMPQSALRDGANVIVNITGVEGGLVAMGGPVPLGVELCESAPATCRFALASAQGNRLIIAVPDGMAPSGIRYAWADAPIVNLYDEGGMPVPGFALDIAP